jgi:hypothetical protein
MAQHKGHFLVLGITGTGKGALVSGVADRYRGKGVPVFLLTKKKDEYQSFPADCKTLSAERLMENLAKFHGKTGAMVVIDEAWAWKWKGLLEEIPNAGRSKGFEMWVQGQRAYQMPPTVRNNCQNVFAFRQNPDDREWLVKNYGPEFDGVDRLEPGEYIFKAGLAPAVRGRSFVMDGGTFRRA